jgi:hypothetical protein
MWNLPELADRLFAVIRDAESALRLEQAVYGLDFRDEIQIHELLAAGLRAHYEVAREVHYPSSAGKKLSHRKRCDLVLTLKGFPLRPHAQPELFDPERVTEPGNALWMEVKVAYQFREGGLRHRSYGTQWRTHISNDLAKMDAEPLIRDAAIALVVFNELEAILEKDLEHFEAILVHKDVLAGFRQVRTVPIMDRIGHRFCSIALWPTIRRH